MTWKIVLSQLTPCTIKSLKRRLMIQKENTGLVLSAILKSISSSVHSEYPDYFMYMYGYGSSLISVSYNQIRYFLLHGQVLTTRHLQGSNTISFLLNKANFYYIPKLGNCNLTEEAQMWNYSLILFYSNKPLFLRFWCNRVPWFINKRNRHF